MIVYLLISHGNLRNDEPSAVYDFAEVQSFEPSNGSFSGGTTVTITVRNVPAMMAVGTVSVTVAGRGCANPEFTVSGISVWKVTCTTEPVSHGMDELREGPVQIMFVLRSITDLTVSSSPQKFRFVDATVDERPSTDRNQTATASAVDGSPATDYVPTLDYWAQRFRGIVSGGTAMPVRGTSLSRASNVTMYVMDQKMVCRRSAGCRLLDDTCMVCRSPVLKGDGAPTALRFGFLAVDAGTGRALDLGPPPDAVRYLLYPDPVLVDFATDDGRRAVVINGRDLHRGYGIDDVTVRSREHAGRCDVTLVAADKIVCRSAWPGRLDQVRDIVVSVGVAFERNVTRTLLPAQGSRPSRAVFHRYAAVGVAVIGLFLTLCALSLLFAFCSKTNDHFDFTRMDDKHHLLNQ